MNEDHRQAHRDELLNVGITAFAELPDGQVLEGVVRDVSDGGARISGPTEGMSVGDELRVVLVIDRDQKVAHVCDVRHVDHETESYGVAFKSKPQLLEGPNPATKYCHRCNRRYAAEWVFCGQCGTELKSDYHAFHVADDDLFAPKPA